MYTHRHETGGSFMRVFFREGRSPEAGLFQAFPEAVFTR